MKNVSELFSEKNVKVWLENLPSPQVRYIPLDTKEIFSTFEFGAANMEYAVRSKEIYTKRYVADFHLSMEQLVDDSFVRKTDKEEYEDYLRKEIQARIVHYLYGEIRKELEELTYEVMRLEHYSSCADPFNGPSARLKNIIQKISL